MEGSACEVTELLYHYFRREGRWGDWAVW